MNGDRVAERRVARPVLAALATLLAIVLVLVGVGAFAVYRVYTLGNHRFIDQTAPFFAVTEDLAVEMLNQETAVRGYVITGDPKTLAPYTQGKKYAAIELALIAKDQSFDPHIPADLKKMQVEVNALEAYFSHEIALVKQGPAGKRRAQTDILSGKGHFDHLRAASAALINDAGAVIKHSHKEQRSTLTQWWIFLGVAGGVALLVAIGLILRVPRRLIALVREEHRARLDAEQSADAARALAHVREAVVLVDADGVVRYRNPTAQEWFAEGAIPDVEAGVGPQRVSLEGGERWLSVAETEFDDGTVLVYRDISDDQRLERLRADFVATAAHELRTPLAAVYGAVRTLRERDGLPEETTARFLELIEQEAERLKTIVDQLLISAQLDTTELQLHPQAVDVAALCASIFAAAETHLPAGIKLGVDRPTADVLVRADPDRLAQVLANLIDNAIKYSPEGGRVDVRLRADGDSGVIEIVDDGVGIPGDEHERVFERFYRLDPNMTRGVGGSGLGLYISRQLVEQMRGTLTLASRYGNGSTFTVTLPLVAQPVAVVG
ncbi:MAG TPA: ATP-binding protein [Gaiellaceae bacterium]|jgi:signal transduction histidine kinase